MLYRVIIKKETKDYFIGKSYSNKKYKIMKNEFSKRVSVGNDLYLYAKRQEGLFYDILIPISDEEAGVKNINLKTKV